ncbi:MAG: NAD-dependent epimerase/dehydratase family protein [Verrucomicrobiota bacterium]|nr:NAD-dependent epimerase/dehydratase family protein [Verrucomicrobiota bacterium]
MKILVTGGRGFVGRAIAKKLIELGHEVETLSRALHGRNKCGVKHHQIDLSKNIQDREVFDGVECVFHVAAKAGIDGPFKEYYTANFLGTQNLLKVSKEKGVQYFIYTSSPSVVFSGKPIINGREDMPYVSSRMSSYSLTKAMAEKEVLNSNSNGVFSTIALRPHLIWGEGDPHLLPKVISRHRSGKLKIVGNGQNHVDLTHIDNVVEAHIAAFNNLVLGSPIGGNAYFISQNEPVNLWDWLNSLFKSLNLKPLNKRISFRKAYVAGAALESLWKILPIKSDLPMSRFVACQLAHDHWFSTQAAKSDFGYEPVLSMDAAMKKTISWLRNT